MQVKSIKSRSAILSTFVKLPFVIKIFVLSIIILIIVITLYNRRDVGKLGKNLIKDKTKKGDWLCLIKLFLIVIGTCFLFLFPAIMVP